MVWNLSSSMPLKIEAFSAIKFPLSTALAASQKFWYVMLLLSFSSKFSNFPIHFPFTHCFFRNILFCFQIFGIFQGFFSVIGFYVNSTVTIECILYDLNLLKCIETGLMAQNMVILVNVPWKECIFCCYLVKCSINVKSSWLTVLFKSSISLFIFCLHVPSVIERVILKSLTI